ncbi:AAA family ATPase [Sinomicrobium weinanense]|uniref:ATP-binding protein n=1 Tax=Sinomicrobium weinanense TaxID=2842200 RepID=A0A926JRN4_9FLAO|nr:ATP-binding protein [Sinomicrobium weinanense]MBU3122300.1 ATP-binding protein [Sinomicrobium weinanense]
MNTKKIVITGGPGTGKSSVLQELSLRGDTCFPEISRQVTLEAQKQGIAQLFLTDPLLFSKKLLESRRQQYAGAEKEKAGRVFIDRGVHDVLAYMDYAGTSYPPDFTEICKHCRYDVIFVLPPWEDIYVSDNERYENFQQAEVIHHFIKSTYIAYGYELVEVPIGPVSARVDFMLKYLETEKQW